jgi:predicted amidohydrolase
MTDSIRLGVVQPQAWGGEAARRMLDAAVGYIEEAGRRGVDLLLFPELYPGPVSYRIRYEVLDRLSAAAAANRVAVAAGTSIKAADAGPRAYHISHTVFDAKGEIKGEYLRTHPRSHVYRNLYLGNDAYLEFEYIAGDQFPVFDMGWGKLAISICSEMYVPEVARILALRGAEICLFPCGLLVDDLGFTENWQSLVRARAIENVIYTATTQNLFGAELLARYTDRPRLPVDPATGVNRGLAMIASPERVLGRLEGPGLLVADLDLARLRRMRLTPEWPDGVTFPPPFVSTPGVLSLRRPDLTAEPLSHEASRLIEYPR